MNTENNTYIYVPFSEKDQAKAMGAKWDNEVQSWYVPDGLDVEKFKAWKNPPIQTHANAEQEFSDFLRSFNVDLPSGHPILDGKFHRLHVAGDKANSTNASYIANEENGRIWGSFKNFKTGEEAKFSSSRSYQNIKSPQEIENVRKEAERKQQAIYDNTKQVANAILSAAPIAQNHPYLVNKQVSAHNVYLVPDPSLLPPMDEVKIAHDWREAKQMRDYFKQNNQEVTILTKGDLIVPAFNSKGEVTTLQTISFNEYNQSSFKSYLKNGQKTGSYLILGEIEDGKPLIVAEGYATGATLHEQTGRPVAIAFDAGNLKHTSLALRESYPNSVIYLMADNDHQTQAERIAKGETRFLNPGIEKATEAANLVGGYVVTPKFEAHESASDWNDLYTLKGSEEVNFQIRSQLVDIQLEKSADLKINKLQVSDRDLAEVQDRVIGRALNNPERMIDLYIRKPETFNGRYIASDMMKEVFDEYNQSPQARNHYNSVIHNTAAALAAKHLSAELGKPVEQGLDRVVFLTGSPGAGKTSSVLEKGELASDVKLVFEGQLANSHQNTATENKIQQAIDNGLKVEIVAINPLPEQALENTFRRFYDPNDGRGASIATMARIQGNTYDGLKYLHDKFGDNISLTIVNKPNGNEKSIKYQGWQHLDVLKSQGTEAEIKQRLETHLINQYSQGKIDYECFKQAAGNEQQANELISRMDRRIHQGLGENEQGRGLPPRSSEPSNQLGEEHFSRVTSGAGFASKTQRGLSQTESGVDRRAERTTGGQSLKTPIQAVSGTHSGTIISIENNTITQQKLNGTLVHHDAQKLPNLTQKDIGSSVKITYHKDGASFEPAGKTSQKIIEKDKQLDNQGKGFGLDDD